MKNKKYIILIAIIIILIIYVLMFHPKGEIASMEKMISKQIKTKQTVSMYNTIIFDNFRLGAYILKNSKEYKEIGYGYFKLNHKGNYELINIINADKITKKTHDITIYKFSKLNEEISELNRKEFSINTSIFIISNNPQLAKIEQIMDHEEVQIEEINTNPSVSFFEELDGNIKIKYNFYDKNGNVIK